MLPALPNNRAVAEISNTWHKLLVLRLNTTKSNMYAKWFNNAIQLYNNKHTHADAAFFSYVLISHQKGGCSHVCIVLLITQIQLI